MVPELLSLNLSPSVSEEKLSHKVLEPRKNNTHDSVHSVHSIQGKEEQLIQKTHYFLEKFEGELELLRVSDYDPRLLKQLQQFEYLLQQALEIVGQAMGPQDLLQTLADLAANVRGYGLVSGDSEFFTLKCITEVLGTAEVPLLERKVLEMI